MIKIIERIVNRGCGGYNDYFGDFDCSHKYEWYCEDCPMNDQYAVEKLSDDELLILITEISNNIFNKTLLDSAIALETAGERLLTTAIPFLVKSLESEHAIIREASIYGLSYSMDILEAREAIKSKQNDISRAASEAAKYAIDSWQPRNNITQ